MKSLIPAFALGSLLLWAPTQANPSSRMVQERFKTVLNELVTRVRAAEKPADKREIMLRFVTHMEESFRKAQSMQGLTETDRVTLRGLERRFHGYAVELDGRDGYVPVSDMDLNDYAGYMQQQMEQAPVGGGIYISAGALLVILLILLLIL